MEIRQEKCFKYGALNLIYHLNGSLLSINNYLLIDNLKYTKYSLY